jgi:DNA-binding NarL/FixJ family response regulator
LQDEPGTISVGLCDSHDISLLGLERALIGHGLSVFGTATREQTALLLAGSARNAVVLVDVQLEPAPDALAAVIEAVLAAGGIPIAISVDGSSEAMFEALRAGAAGFLTKDMPAHAFVEAIRAAHRGEPALSRSFTVRLIEEFRSISQPASLAQLMPSDRRLTEREWQVLERVATGLTNRRVADELSISIETVRTHVSHILAKLEAPNRSAAVAQYHQLRLARA